MASLVFNGLQCFLGDGLLVVNLLLILEAIFCISPGRAKFTVYRDGSTCSRGLNSKDIPLGIHSSGFDQTNHFDPLDSCESKRTRSAAFSSGIM
jgi:hypothetical protein